MQGGAGGDVAVAHGTGREPRPGVCEAALASGSIICLALEIVDSLKMRSKHRGTEWIMGKKIKSELILPATFLP